MPRCDTTIPVSLEMRDRLHDRKSAGETYEDVLAELLKGER